MWLASVKASTEIEILRYMEEEQLSEGVTTFFLFVCFCTMNVPKAKPETPTKGEQNNSQYVCNSLLKK